MHQKASIAGKEVGDASYKAALNIGESEDHCPECFLTSFALTVLSQYTFAILQNAEMNKQELATHIYKLVLEVGEQAEHAREALKSDPTFPSYPDIKKH